MSALTDLKARITGPDGHLRDRGTIAAELERAIEKEGLKVCEYAVFGIVSHGLCSVGSYISKKMCPGNVLCPCQPGASNLTPTCFPADTELDVTAADLGRTFARLAAKQEARP